MPVNPDELWFNTPDVQTLCRAGGNGPDHPSQLYAINKYVKDGMTFLDYGAGSGTTCEALIQDRWLYPLEPEMDRIKYCGLDVIPKNVEWCQQQFIPYDFAVNKTIHKIDQPDKSWDVVYSRHVVDHMESFEGSMDEHCRVAKQLVIAVFWVPMCEGEHQIKHITDAPGTDHEKFYKDEYTNQYSRSKVMEYLNQKQAEGWELVEFTEEVGVEVKGHDWIIVLRRKDAI